MLVVSATAVEASYVPADLPLLVTGVGKVAAATAVATALARYEPQVVVNIGTAGALRPGISGVVLPSVVLNHDISAALLAAVGVEVPTALEVPGGDGSVLATGDVFVTDPAVRDELATRAGLVDMEAFAVAWACAYAGVPCRIVKHISDTADNAALDWASIVEASARDLGAWLAAAQGSSELLPPAGAGPAPGVTAPRT